MSTDLLTAVNMMWQGMLGLFVVMALISLIVFMMLKLGNK